MNPFKKHGNTARSFQFIPLNVYGRVITASKEHSSIILTVLVVHGLKTSFCRIQTTVET